MQKKFAYKLLLFFAVAIVLLGVGHTALALEVTYPVIPGFPDINQRVNQDLPFLIDYFFGFALAAAGIIGIFTIVLAGFKILLSAGNPSAISEARENIFGAVFGIVLLMVSFIILQTINPGLINQRTVGLDRTIPNGPQIWRYVPPATYNNFNPFAIATASANASFTDMNGIEITLAANFDPDTTDTANAKLVYICGADKNPLLKVDVYSETEGQIDFDDNNNNSDETTEAENTLFIPCGNSWEIINADETINTAVLAAHSVDLALVKSFDWEYLTPGVYLYVKDNCQGISIGAITESGEIPADFQKLGVRSARIINGDKETDPKYGFVLSDAPELKGQCTSPYMNVDNSKSITDETNTGMCISLASNLCTP